jgi:hypothetical protein
MILRRKKTKKKEKNRWKNIRGGNVVGNEGRREDRI